MSAARPGFPLPGRSTKRSSPSVSPASSVGPELDVSALDDVEARQHTGSGHTPEDVGASALHQAHEALVLDDLLGAVDGALVGDAAAGGHHHSSPDGVDGVGAEAGDDGHGPADEEGDNEAGVGAHHGFDGVVQPKVETSVDEDTNTRDNESSVDTLNTISGQSLPINVNQTVVLPSTVLGLVIISQPSPSKVQRVDEEQRHGPSDTTGSDVASQFSGVTGVLGHGDHSLDLVFEGKVQGLGGEVPQDVGQVAPPEGSDAFRGQDALGAVDHAGVGLVEAALLDHLVLVLDQELDSLDGGGGRLGDARGHAGEHEVLEKA